jgi:hypothetical protein
MLRDIDFLDSAYRTHSVGTSEALEQAITLWDRATISLKDNLAVESIAHYNRAAALATVKRYSEAGSAYLAAWSGFILTQDSLRALNALVAWSALGGESRRDAAKLAKELARRLGSRGTRVLDSKAPAILLLNPRDSASLLFNGAVAALKDTSRIQDPVQASKDLTFAATRLASWGDNRMAGEAWRLAAVASWRGGLPDSAIAHGRHALSALRATTPSIYLVLALRDFGSYWTELGWADSTFTYLCEGDRLLAVHEHLADRKEFYTNIAAAAKRFERDTAAACVIGRRG